MIIDIINNKNLTYDLKKDIIFKKVFLNEKNINYLKTLIIYLLNINIDNIKLANAEIPNSIINKKSSYADLVLKDDNNNEYIIEMNYIYSKSLHYKNYHYLLKEHTKRSHKNNMLELIIIQY